MSRCLPRAVARAAAVLLSVVTRAPASAGPASASQAPQPPVPAVVQSQRWESGVPLGGVGCGTVELRTDGTFGRITINNNAAQPISRAPGCFAAVWTSAGGRVDTRVLALRNEMRLPCVASVAYEGRYPQALVEYSDPALPVAIRLRAYSPLIPRDIRNSSLPVALFVFTITNRAHAPVDAALAMSWENLLGVGGTLTGGAFADRTGCAVEAEAAREGLFGLRMSGPPLPAQPPPNRLPYNARGNYALLVDAARPDVDISTAGWNALASSPPWWPDFAARGAVSGAVAEGVEGSVHPAGVVALRASLKDGETIEVPFALAWYTPRHYALNGAEYGHLYEKSFVDAPGVARYALSNRRSLAALTEEWQNRLLRSSLPGWLARKMINDAHVLATNTVLTRDSGVDAPDAGTPILALLSNPGAHGGRAAPLDERLYAHPLVTAMFPGLEWLALSRIATTTSPVGALPRYPGDAEGALLPDPPSAGASATDLAGPADVAALVAQTARFFLWTGDRQFLGQQYPALKRAVERVARGMSVAGAPAQIDRPQVAAIRWLGALRVAEALARRMEDLAFAGECAEWGRAARARAEGFWSGAFYGAGPTAPALCDSGQLAGEWLASLGGATTGLTVERLRETLASIRRLNDAAPARVPPRTVAANGAVPPGARCSLPEALTAGAALYARDDAAAALALAARLAAVTADPLRSPWSLPAEVDALTGAAASPTGELSAAASWYLLDALAGCSADLAEGYLALLPVGVGPLEPASLPLFAPGFWARLTASVSDDRWVTILRVDRILSAPGQTTAGGAAREGEHGHTALRLSRIAVRDPGWPVFEATASDGRVPVAARAAKGPEGVLVFQFEPPLSLTAGQRIELAVERNPQSAR